MNEKAVLRREMRARRNATLANYRAVRSARINVRLAELWNEIDRSPRRVVAYLAQLREANIDDFIRSLQAQGVLLAAPQSREGAPFYPIAPDWSNVQLNARGWREPAEYSGAPSFDLREEDAILLPGLAFDLTGSRLGQGGGWYDRVLENLPAGVLRIGIGFDFQLIDAVPREPHDQTVSIIVTDKRILHARP